MLPRSGPPSGGSCWRVRSLICTAALLLGVNAIVVSLGEHVRFPAHQDSAYLLGTPRKRDALLRAGVGIAAYRAPATWYNEDWNAWGYEDTDDTTARVLLDKSLADSFDADVVDPNLPDVVSVHTKYNCRMTWDIVKSAGDNRLDESLQAVGFLRFLNNFYPKHSVAKLDALKTAENVPKGAFLFLPMCPFEAGWLSRPVSDDPNGRAMNMRAAMERCRETMSSPEMHDIAERLLRVADDGRIFYVPTTPIQGPRDKPVTPVRRIRGLYTDSTVFGSHGHISLPMSVAEKNCPIDFDGGNNTTRTSLVSMVGRDKPNGAYPHLRKRIREGLKSLVATGDDDDRVLTLPDGVTPDDYDRTFFTSKFCLVIPGDTTSTSQGARAMCGGCVPVFVAPDYRDLAFANLLDYSKFSVRLRPHELVTMADYMRLVDHLADLVESGAYEKLRQNVMIARDFFNFHRFTGRSPYAAALTSIMVDFGTRFK